MQRTQEASVEALVHAVVDAHLRIRDLVRGLAHAKAGGRVEPGARLIGRLAVHLAAERVALDPPGSPYSAALVEHERALTEAVERLDDLGPDGRSFAVPLGLLADALVRHVDAVERDVLPRFAASHDDADLRRAVEVLGMVDAVDAAEASSAPRELVGFGHRLRELRTLFEEALRG